jgi:hypothetical protein
VAVRAGFELWGGDGFLHGVPVNKPPFSVRDGFQI